MAADDPDQKRLKLRQLLIAARGASGLTQAQLAERLGRRQNFVSAYERGRDIEVVEFLQIAEALGLDAKGVIEELHP
jgi:transcriptional regulator with XRE-family HTH domain